MRKQDVKKLLLVILILILIDSVVFVITEGFGENLVTQTSHINFSYAP